MATASTRTRSLTMPSEMDTGDVAVLLGSLTKRHLGGLSMPVGNAFVMHFTHPDDPDRRMRFEVNIGGGTCWLHEYDDDGETVEVWSNKGVR